MKSKKSKSSFAGKIRKNAEQNERGSNYGYLKIPKGINMFTPDTDTRVIMDIMPYEVTDKHHPDIGTIEVGDLWYKRPFKTHRSVGVNNDTVVCPKSFGKKCPICEYRAKLQKEGGEEEEIRALKPTDKNLYAVILRGKKADKKNDKKIHLFNFSNHLFQKEFYDQLGDTDEFETFPDHTQGTGIEVRFGEDNFAGVKFPKPTRFDWAPRSVQYDDDILEEIPKLDELFIVLSYEELRAKFFELEEDEEEEEETTSRKKKTSTAKNKKVEEDDDEEEEEDDDDEQDADDDEDDNDEDDNDDEDDDSDDDDDEDDDDDDEDDDDEDDDDEDDEPVKPSKKTKSVPVKSKTPVKTAKKSPVKTTKKSPVKTTKRKR